MDEIEGIVEENLELIEPEIEQEPWHLKTISREDWDDYEEAAITAVAGIGDRMIRFNILLSVMRNRWGLPHELDHFDYVTDLCMGRFKYVPSNRADKLGTFFLWNSCRWSENGSKVKGCKCESPIDDEGVISLQIIQEEIAQTLRERSEDLSFLAWEMANEIIPEPNDEHGRQIKSAIGKLISRVWALSNNMTGKQGVSTLAAVGSRPGLSVHGTDFDADPWKMNFGNGVLNLRTGEIVPNTADTLDLHTKVAGCDFDKDCDYSEWAATVLEMCSGDKEVADYLQERMGTTMTGYCYESATQFIQGKGGRRKNTFIEPCVGAFGEYGFSSNPSVLTTESKGGPDEDQVDLMGRRLVWLDEGISNKVLASNKFKGWTGQDRGGTITASRKFQGNLTFNVVFNFWWTCEDLPKLPELKDGEKRRIKVVVFNNPVIGAHDSDVKSRLKTENMKQQIMAWAYDGLHRVLERDVKVVKEPFQVRQWSGEYFDEQDLFKQFFLMKMVPLDDPSTMEKMDPRKLPAGTATSIVTAAYREWLGDNGHDPKWGKANVTWVKGRLANEHNIAVIKKRGSDPWEIGSKLFYSPGNKKEVYTERLMGWKLIEGGELLPEELAEIEKGDVL